jgi:thiol-disulfide isomerase/thioredoxin
MVNARSFLLVVLLTPQALAAQKIVIGKPAPDFTLTTFGDTTKVRLSQLRGHPVVVSFWASWCPPCRVEMPELAAAYQANRSAGLEVLTVNEEPLEVDEKGKGVYRSKQEHEKRLRLFLDQVALPFPVLADGSAGTVWAHYGQPWLPAMFFVDSAGIVRAKFDNVVPADSLAKGLRTILSAAMFRP